MGLFGRINQLVKAAMAPAEDPRQAYASAGQRQQDLLVKVQAALRELEASKVRLQSKTAETNEKLPRLEEQAKQALIEGHEDIARLSLRRRQVALVELKALGQQVAEVEADPQRLSLLEERIATEIEAFRARQDIIAARYNAAEAQVQLGEALTGVSDDLAQFGTALEKAEERAQYMQARAAAIDQLVDDGVLRGPTLGADPTGMTVAEAEITQAVEDQLAALKQQVSAQLPPQH